MNFKEYTDSTPEEDEAEWLASKEGQLATKLEEFRKASIIELKRDMPNIERHASKFFGRPVKAKIIGSVLDPNRFREDSDIDVGIYIKARPGEKRGVSETLSMKLQETFIDTPYKLFGVLNTIVFLI
jgi:hypothetical protein